MQFFDGMLALTFVLGCTLCLFIAERRDLFQLLHIGDSTQGFGSCSSAPMCLIRIPPVLLVGGIVLFKVLIQRSKD